MGGADHRATGHPLVSTCPDVYIYQIQTPHNLELTTKKTTLLLLLLHSEGGFFKAHLFFPKEYPLRPPRMKFVTEIWHPNIEKNGDVCISILHEPGDDKWGYEKASERWLPVHTVETILISVISMLADPNDESPANVDAAKEWRESYPDFKRKVARCVRKSQEEP